MAIGIITIISDQSVNRIPMFWDIVDADDNIIV